MSTATLLSLILSFLKYKTPDAWIDKAKQPENLPIILIDHLICEQIVNMCKLGFSNTLTSQLLYKVNKVRNGYYYHKK